MEIFIYLAAACWATFLIVWAVTSFGIKKSVGGWGRWLAVRAILLAVIFAVLGNKIFTGDSVHMSRASGPANIPLGVIGVLLCMAGIGFAIWARKHLGKNWGMPMSIKEKPDLVTTGPYTYVRHPIYTGMLLALAGSAIVGGQWEWLVPAALFAAYFVYSAKVEEKNMSKIFPDQYPEYKKRSKMLIPFVF
ncbi:MAG TPA: isoprenylcysteine carboxylmethyltransferase family protein [Candidatus Paceibacterota bacterium]|jgi:protein-S-isoprenylcysteine O-methyltransferase Ste14|nr:isoprenylcysteine carboxylmethyltransferase family protein [Candidatus Paceibacterota bacterium]